MNVRDYPSDIPGVQSNVDVYWSDVSDVHLKNVIQVTTYLSPSQVLAASKLMDRPVMPGTHQRTHPIAAVCHEVAGEVLQTHRTGTYLELGTEFGNGIMRHSAYDVTARDEARAFKKDKDAVGALWSRSNCHNGSEHCGKVVDTIIMHGVHDLSPAEFVQTMSSHGASKGVLTMIIPPEMFSDVPILMDNDDHYKYTEMDGKGVMTFGDSSLGYSHDIDKWKAWGETTFLSAGGKNYVFEVVSKVGIVSIVHVYVALRGDTLVKANVTPWDKYVRIPDIASVYDELSTLMVEGLDWSKERLENNVMDVLRSAPAVAISAFTYDKCVAFASSRKDTSFDRVTMGVHFNAQQFSLTINGKEIHDTGIRLGCEEASWVRIMIFLHAAVIRYRETKLIGKAMSAFSGFKSEGWFSRLWKWLGFGSTEMNFMGNDRRMQVLMNCLSPDIIHSTLHCTTLPAVGYRDLPKTMVLDYHLGQPGDCLDEVVEACVWEAVPFKVRNSNAVQLRIAKEYGSLPITYGSNHVYLRGDQGEICEHAIPFTIVGRLSAKSARIVQHRRANEEVIRRLREGTSCTTNKRKTASILRHFEEESSTKLSIRSLFTRRKPRRRNFYNFCAAPGNDHAAWGNRDVVHNIITTGTHSKNAVYRLGPAQAYNLNLMCQRCLDKTKDAKDRVVVCDFGSDANNKDLVASLCTAIYNMSVLGIQYVLKIQRFFEIFLTDTPGSAQLAKYLVRHNILDVDGVAEGEIYVTNTTAGKGFDWAFYEPRIPGCKLEDTCRIVGGFGYYCHIKQKVLPPTHAPRPPAYAPPPVFGPNPKPKGWQPPNHATRRPKLTDFEFEGYPEWFEMPTVQQIPIEAKVDRLDPSAPPLPVDDLSVVPSAPEFSWVETPGSDCLDLLAPVGGTLPLLPDKVVLDSDLILPPEAFNDLLQACVSERKMPSVTCTGSPSNAFIPPESATSEHHEEALDDDIYAEVGNSTMHLPDIPDPTTPSGTDIIDLGVGSQGRDLTAESNGVAVDQQDEGATGDSSALKLRTPMQKDEVIKKMGSGDYVPGPGEDIRGGYLIFNSNKTILSNLAPCSITIDGVDYHCSEQAYAHLKCLAADDAKQADAVMSAVDGWDVMKHATKNRLPRNVTVDIMERVLFEKYKQSSAFSSVVDQAISQGLLLAEGTQHPLYGSGVKTNSSAIPHKQGKLGEIMHDLFTKDNLAPNATDEMLKHVDKFQGGVDEDHTAHVRHKSVRYYFGKPFATPLHYITNMAEGVSGETMYRELDRMEAHSIKTRCDLACAVAFTDGARGDGVLFDGLITLNNIWSKSWERLSDKLLKKCPHRVPEFDGKVLGIEQGHVYGVLNQPEQITFSDVHVEYDEAQLRRARNHFINNNLKTNDKKYVEVHSAARSNIEKHPIVTGRRLTKGFEGVPGSGKTASLSQLLPPDSEVVVVVPFSSLKKEYVKRGYCAFTVAAAMANSPKREKVILDEVFTMHPYVLMWAISHFDQVYWVGDRMQMGYNNGENAVPLPTIIGTIATLLSSEANKKVVSYTVPIDIVRWVNQIFPEVAMRTRNPYFQSVHIKRADMPRGLTDAMVLTKNEKHLGMGNTVASQQGMRYTDVHLNWCGASYNLMQVHGMALVMLTRHSGKIYWYVTKNHIIRTPAINKKVYYPIQFDDELGHRGSYLYDGDFREHGGGTISEGTMFEVKAVENNGEAAKQFDVKVPPSYLINHDVLCGIASATPKDVDPVVEDEVDSDDLYKQSPLQYVTAGDAEEVLNKISPTSSQPFECSRYTALKTLGNVKSGKLRISEANHVSNDRAVREVTVTAGRLRARDDRTGTWDRTTQCVIKRYASGRKKYTRQQAKTVAEEAFQGFLKFIDKDKIQQVTEDDLGDGAISAVQRICDKKQDQNSAGTVFEHDAMVPFFLKGQAKVDMKPDGWVREDVQGEIKAAQGVSPLPKTYNHLASLYVAAVSRNLQKAMKEGCSLGYGRPPAELRKVVSKWKGKHYITTDITQMDVNRGHWADLFMRKVWTLFGVPKTIQDVAEAQHNDWTLRVVGMNTKLQVKEGYQSGCPWTLDSNTMVGMGYVGMSFKIKRLHGALFQGDDVSVCADSVVRTAFCPTEMKIESEGATGAFCGLLLHDGKVCLDLPRLVAKLMNKCYPNDSQLYQYRIAVRDWLSLNKTVQQQVDTIIAAKLHYGITELDSNVLLGALWTFAKGGWGRTLPYNRGSDSDSLMVIKAVTKER